MNLYESNLLFFAFMFLHICLLEIVTISLLHYSGYSNWFTYIIALLSQTFAYVNIHFIKFKLFKLFLLFYNQKATSWLARTRFRSFVCFQIKNNKSFFSKNNDKPYTRCQVTNMFIHFCLKKNHFHFYKSI